MHVTDQFSRSRLVLGENSAEILAGARVAVFGLGGVGGAAAEALARGGVGHLDIIDDDLVCVTNINRQLIATVDTVGMSKVDAAEQRIRSINPECRVVRHRTFYLPEESSRFDFAGYDYVVDAIDTVKGKIGLIRQAAEAGTPVISAMGAGNKLDPTAFRVADIYETSGDPLARVIRRECRKLGIPGLKVVYSNEAPHAAASNEEAGPVRSTDAVPDDDKNDSNGAPGQAAAEKSVYCRNCPADVREACSAGGKAVGSVSFVPPVMGMIMAGEVIRDLLAADNGAGTALPQGRNICIINKCLDSQGK